MGEMNRKEVMNELYDTTLITFGAVGISMVTKKVFGEKLTTAENRMSTLKLEAAVGVSSLAVKYAQDKNGYLLILSNYKKN